MSLSVDTRQIVDYSTEKGDFWLIASISSSTDALLDLISNFLATFSSNETDMTAGFAGFGIDDDDDATPTRTKNLKYMQQLVRVLRF